MARPPAAAKSLRWRESTTAANAATDTCVTAAIRQQTAPRQPPRMAASSSAPEAAGPPVRAQGSPPPLPVAGAVGLAIHPPQARCQQRRRGRQPEHGPARRKPHRIVQQPELRRQRQGDYRESRRHAAAAHRAGQFKRRSPRRGRTVPACRWTMAPAAASKSIARPAGSASRFTPSGQSTARATSPIASPHSHSRKTAA